jgi:hypothetical protein
LKFCKVFCLYKKHIKNIFSGNAKEAVIRHFTYKKKTDIEHFPYEKKADIHLFRFEKKADIHGSLTVDFRKNAYRPCVAYVFLSNFLFYGIVFSGILCYNRGKEV